MNFEWSCSKSATFGGMLLFVTTLYIAAWEPRFPLWLAILIGVALAMPLMIIGFRLDPGSSRNSSRRFMPTRMEMWTICGSLSVVVLPGLPLLVFLLLLRVLPDGDTWALAALRAFGGALFVFGTLQWATFSKGWCYVYFRGKASDLFVQSIGPQPLPERPRPVTNTVDENLHFLVILSGSLLVLWSLANFDTTWQLLQVEPGSFKGLGRLLMWFKGHPNSVGLIAVVVAITASVVFVRRCCGSMLNQKTTNSTLE